MSKLRWFKLLKNGVEVATWRDHQPPGTGGPQPDTDYDEVVEVDRPGDPKVEVWTREGGFQLASGADDVFHLEVDRLTAGLMEDQGPVSRIHRYQADEAAAILAADPLPEDLAAAFPYLAAQVRLPSLAARQGRLTEDGLRARARLVLDAAQAEDHRRLATVNAIRIAAKRAVRAAQTVKGKAQAVQGLKKRLADPDLCPRPVVGGIPARQKESP